MAVLKKIKFGTGTATPIAQTVVTAASESVLSVVGTNTGIDDNADPSYAVDLNISADGTLVKDTTNTQAVLKVGTVPAAQVSVTDSGDKFIATTVEAALAELKDDIDSTGGAAKTYKIVESASPASTSLKEYKVQVAVGSGAFADDTNSATIVVPKDNAFVTAQLGHVGATADSSTGAITDGSGEDALLIEYVNGSGVYTLVAVPIGAFLKEAEFKDGLAVNASGEVSAKLGNGIEFGNEATGNKSLNVKIDSTSSDAEQFLSVGANGVKISGVQDAIDTSIAALDVTTDAAVAGQYVAAIEETDGVVAVKTRANVSDAVLTGYTKGNAPAAGSEAVAATDDVKGAIAKLEHQVDAAKSATTSAIQNLDNTDTAVAGQVVTAVSTADGIASPTKADLAGITLGGFTADSSAAAPITSSDTLGAAINKLQNQISAAADDHTVVEHASGNTHVTVTGAANANGGTTYTVTESDIASAQGLANEITARKAVDGQSGDTYVANSNTNYISSATSLNNADVLLDAQVKANADAIAAITATLNGTLLTFNGIAFTDQNA